MPSHNVQDSDATDLRSKVALAQRRLASLPGSLPNIPASAQTGARVGLYVLLIAMSTGDIFRPASGALRAHVNGLGQGYSDFNYGSGGPSLQHLVARVELAEQLSLIEGGEETTDPSGAVVPNEPEPAAADRQSDVDTVENASFDSYVMEIEDDPDVDEVAGAPDCADSHALGAMKVAKAGVVRPAHINDLSDVLIARALEHLSFDEIAVVRGVSRKFAGAASMICPQPFGDDRITFVRCSGLSSLAAPTPNPHAPPVPFTWRCANCNGYSSYHEACTTCGENIRVAGCRVFVGQVRKQHTAIAVAGMLQILRPSVRVLHIESHSNKDGYEKGAAWVYVDSPQQALEVLDLNKRILFDVDASGNEGFWYVSDDSLKPQLQVFASTRKVDEARRAFPLPGQALVAELPQRSMLHGWRPLSLRNAVSQRAPRSANGWYANRSAQSTF